MTHATRRPCGQSGFALILSILALMLLTFLGLTLATTTSTELQISANYRFSQQALYNAEAGVEVGKALLRDMNWSAVLPAARTAPWTPPVSTPTTNGGVAAPFSRPDAWGNPTRNFTNTSCDTLADGMGFGVVLDDGSAAAPYQYKDRIFGQQLQGAFTLWIRRPTAQNQGLGSLVDYSQDDDNLILVSEGVAPYQGASIAGFGRGRQAVRVLEVALMRGATTGSGKCGGRTGQSGGGQFGGGFDPCDNLGKDIGASAALPGGVTGTGQEIDVDK
jgi:Tfp pilus assembly protein PilX